VSILRPFDLVVAALSWMLFSFSGKGLGVAAIARLLENAGYADVHASMRACVCVHSTPAPASLAAILRQEQHKSIALQLSLGIRPSQNVPSALGVFLSPSCVPLRIGLRCVPDAPPCGFLHTQAATPYQHSSWAVDMQPGARSPSRRKISRWELVKKVVPWKAPACR
jgi:hypothetical protein